jgi:hypothetical protein
MGAIGDQTKQSSDQVIQDHLIWLAPVAEPLSSPSAGRTSLRRCPAAGCRIEGPTREFPSVGQRRGRPPPESHTPDLG